MKYTYNDNEYNIKVIRKNNKNTYIRFKDNEILVTTNYFMTDKSVQKLVLKNKDFINKMIDKSNIKEENNTLMLFGVKYRIIYINGIKTEINDNIIYTSDNTKLNKYLNKLIYNTFYEHLNYWYNNYQENIPTPNLKIRKMKTRWGVCNIRNKNITLNSELSKYPTKCLDYVIVHELSHFLYPNHSKDFWNQVSKYYPNWKEVRKELRN